MNNKIFGTPIKVRDTKRFGRSTAWQATASRNQSLPREDANEARVSVAASSYAVHMLKSSKPPPLAVRLECVSWQLVQHHLRHGALRFENDALQHIRLLHPKDRESHFCLATRPDDLIEVVGMIHYRVICDDLHFEHIRVRKSYRQREIGRRMITEVVTHPVCIGIRRIHWRAGAKGCEALTHHLERLRDPVQGLSGTTFELKVVRTPGPKS